MSTGSGLRALLVGSAALWLATAIPALAYEHVDSRVDFHDGEIVRECMEAEGWTVAECAGRLRVNRVTLSRLLNGRAGVSPTMALALERIGWSNADHWVRMQGSYDLAQARLRESAA